MDTRNGNIVNEDDIPADEKKYFIPVCRDLTVKEKFDLKIKLYSPCACGSSKKFKFCCKINPVKDIKE